MKHAHFHFCMEELMHKNITVVVMILFRTTTTTTTEKNRRDLFSRLKLPCDLKYVHVHHIAKGLTLTANDVRNTSKHESY